MFTIQLKMARHGGKKKTGKCDIYSRKNVVGRN